jgi:hypothetical protein
LDDLLEELLLLPLLLVGSREIEGDAEGNSVGNLSLRQHLMQLESSDEPLPLPLPELSLSSAWAASAVFVAKRA